MESTIFPATLPDLEHGYMIMGADSKNRWQTDVECLLQKTSPHGVQTAFMSHECRGEAVQPEIFGPGIYEFLVIKTWTGTFNLRSGSYNYGFSGKIPETVYEPTEAEPFIQCGERQVSYFTLDEALAFLRSEQQAKSKLYLAAQYRHENADYLLIAPCRYTNFPHPTNEVRRYLQPISGYVLFEDKGRFFTAYIASHVTESGTQSIQFRLRTSTSFIATKNRTARLFPFFDFLDKLFLRRALVTDEFHKILRVDGDCRLFIYT
jgi:hypothetical protein